jgi:hypothetical protein
MLSGVTHPVNSFKDSATSTRGNLQQLKVGGSLTQRERTNEDGKEHLPSPARRIPIRKG